MTKRCKKTRQKNQDLKEETEMPFSLLDLRDRLRLEEFKRVKGVEGVQEKESTCRLG